MSEKLLSRGTALVIALLGVLLFNALGLPLPFLLGPVFLCLAAALLRLPIQDMGGSFQNLMRTVLGVAIGASITADLLEQAQGMLASIALMPLFVAIIGLIGYPYFRRVCGYDHATSYYAAIPGGLQDMLVFGEEAGGNVRALSLIHATRILVIVTLMPLILAYIWGLEFDNAPGKPASAIPLSELLLMAGLGIGGWQLAKRINMFGASILGPLIATAIASLAGFIHHRPPAEAILAAQFFIGLGVGAKYRGITTGEIQSVIVTALGYCVLLAVISVMFAGLVAFLGLAPAVEAILAFSPGGQAEMVVLAIVAGADLPYVLTHHLFRILIVVMGAPITAKLFGSVKKGSTPRS